MQKNNRFTLCLLMTGSELMSGDTLDSNSAFLGQVFNEYGIDIIEKVTVGDDEQQLKEQLLRLANSYDVIFMNGGLGPTQDDLSAKILADVCNVPIIRHRKAEEHVLQWCQARGLNVNAANLKQADLPANTTIFSNAPGSAVAFYVELDKALVIATPGVPSELKQITRQDILPFLQQRFALVKNGTWQQYQLFGIGESSLQQLLDEHFPLLKQEYNIGFRANFPYVELKLKPHQLETDPTQLQKLLQHLHEHRIGPSHSTAASALVELLHQHNKTISTAESCTGGLIASQITHIAGCSAVYPGSIVSYSNAIKHRLLNVDEAVLNAHGAVSEPVANAMLQGLLRTMQCDYGIAVSGVAGPEGGSDEKPVGTVWIAWGSAEQQHSVQLLISQPRLQFQQLVSAIALDLVRRQVAGYQQRPHYLSRWQTKL